MNGPTRREVLVGASSLSLTAALPTAAQATGTTQPNSVADDLARYIGFGSKQSGSEGDTASGHWLAGELEEAGFVVEKPVLSVPYFDPENCEIVINGARAPLWPQPIVIPTPASGVSGPLVRVDGAGRADAQLGGAIALVDLPYGRWSSAFSKSVRGPGDAAFAGGARAVVIVTNGPTGKVIALNADGRAPMFAGPVGLLAPADAAEFLSAATTHDRATVTLTGQAGQRPAFNVIGRMDRKKGNGSSSRHRVPAGTVARQNAAAALPHGSTLRATYPGCCPITISPSFATAAMNMKIWGPRNR
ncbi:hypothetical protein [Sphingopyxis sp. BSNA05]|uniref:hypothetical protein n=1 Tax=Sphingopyxis sp. BSNA05 TaxID=1236614 RepID=UPI001563CFFF|nr:hypothetical protein [Sphingopyxis sp. BSNA05]